MTGGPEAPEALVDKAPGDDRTLRGNEDAIGDLRRQVAAAVEDIARAAARLREVLDTRLPELRQDDQESG